MPVRNIATGQMEPTPKELEKQKRRQETKAKYAGRDKTKLSKVEADEILVRMAQDLGYLD